MKRRPYASSLPKYESYWLVLFRTKIACSDDGSSLPYGQAYAYFRATLREVAPR